MLETLQLTPYDVLLPTHEETYLLARVARRLRGLAHTALPPFESIRRLQSKVGFVAVLEELGLPHPSTAVAATRTELLERAMVPSYVKLAYGTAGVGTTRIERRDELTSLASALERSGALGGSRQLLVQAVAEGTQAVCQVIFQEGRLVGSHCAESRSGPDPWWTTRVSAHHPVVLEHVRALGKHLGWHGAAFFEYFIDDSGQPTYIEANPRLGETVNASLSGVELCEQLVRVALGECVEPLPPGRVGVRTHQGVVALLAAAANGATRRELAREVRRRIAGEGRYRDSQDELVRSGDPLSTVPDWAVAGMLLVSPRLGHELVRRTVNSYALPARAVEEVMALEG